MESRNDLKLVPALERAIRILNLLQKKNNLTITEIANTLSINKSTAFSIMQTLQHFNIVQKNPKTHEYLIGIGLFQFQSEFLDIDREMLEINKKIRSLRDQVNETVSFFKRINNISIVVATERRKGPGLTVGQSVGSVFPLHVTKALLWDCSRQEIEELIGKKYERFTKYTITTIDELTLRLKECKEKLGYVWGEQERNVGVSAVGIPVYVNESMIGSLHIIVPSARFDDQKEYWGECIKKTALEIEDAISKL